MKNLITLINYLKKEEYFYIQTHNFPDHDAVASAFALQQLLKSYNLKSYLVYDGEIQRDSLKSMIKELKIDIKPIQEYDMKETDKIIIVDGCKGNKNVTDLIGDEIAIIDHHEVQKPEDVSFSDIRPNYGSCSTIIFSYYIMLKKEIQKDVATALLIGLNMDTSLLTRGVIEEDIGAYSYLYTLSNYRLVKSILRNYIQQKDLQFYKKAIENIKIEKGVAFCHFEDGCNQNLLGILGDFFLALREVDFVILSAKNDDKINFSIRSENEKLNASQIIQIVLKNIGFGGGHSDMAGGIIKNIKLFEEQNIFNTFLSVIQQFREF